MNGKVRREIKELVNCKTGSKKINEELTYRDLYKSIDNIWSVLFTTGYLTRRGEGEEDEVCHLAIPNLEIRKIFIEQMKYCTFSLEPIASLLWTHSMLIIPSCRKMKNI